MRAYDNLFGIFGTELGNIGAKCLNNSGERIKVGRLARALEGGNRGMGMNPKLWTILQKA